MSTEALTLEAIIRLVAALWDWLTSNDNRQPVSACATALAHMLETDHAARAELIARCVHNPPLRQQLLALCDAYAVRFPVFADIRKDLENATC